jgi:translocation and assembly module TamB
MYKYVRRLLYPVLALAILILAALAVASSAWFHRVLERRVTAELQTLTGARVEIGHMDFSLFTLQITMNRLVLHGSEQPPDPPLFFAQSLAVRLQPLSVGRPQLMLTALDLNRAEVHLYTKADGTSNVPGPLLTSAAGSNQEIEEFLDLQIQRMTVNHTNVYWNNARVALNLRAENVAVQMRRDLARKYQGSLSSSAIQFETPGFSLPPTTVTSRFEITGDGLNVTGLNWRASDFSGESTLQVKATPQIEADAAFNTKGSAVQVAKMFRLGTVEAGEIFLAGRAAYRQDEWQAHGRLEGRQVLVKSRSFNPGRVDFKTDYSATTGGIELPNLEINALGGALRGRASILSHPGSPHCSVHVEVRGTRLRNLLSSLSGGHPLLNSLHWSSTVQGTADASWIGRWENLNTRFALQFQAGVGVPEPSIPVSGSLRAVLTNDHGLKLDLETLDAQTPRSSLQIHGTIQSSQSQLAVELKTSDFEEWRAPAEFLARAGEPIPLALKDPITFSGSLAETEGGPAIRGRISAGKFDFRGWRWNELTADVSIAPSSVQVSGARLRSDKSILNVDAVAALEDWQLDPNGHTRLAARVERTPLEGLKAALQADYPLSGLVTGQITLQGTPTKLTGSGDLRVDQGTLAGRPFDTLTTRIQVADSVWNVADIQLVRGRGKIAGKGSFDPSTRAFTASLRGTDVALSDFVPTSKSATEANGANPFEGQAGFDLEGSGAPDNLTLHAQWNIQNLKVMGMPAGSLQGQLNWQGKKLQATGESAGAGGALHFSGQARTEADWPVELSGDFSDFRLGPWIRLLLNRKFDSSVTSSGTVNVTGPLRHPSELVIESRVRTLQVSASDLAWSNVQPVDLRYADGNLSVSRFRIQGPSTNLEAEGSVRFGGESSLALSARGQSDAQLLSLLDPAVKATGTSKVDLIINGTPEHPLLFGKLEVQDLNLSYGDFPIRLFGMNGEIRLQGERATVQSLRGTSGGGSVIVQGYMAFGGTPVFQVSANVDQVRMQYPTDFISQLTGTLRLSGTPESSRMDGELVVRQLYTTPDFSVLGLLSDVGSSAGAPAIGAASPVASKVHLNVQVLSAPTVRLEAQNLRVVADVDLHLQGTLANPVVVGAIHILNGETVLRGNRYTINRADISMTNPFRTQPMLDLEATTRVQRYDLTLDVTGALDRFKIGYRSDPPLPTADILSLLALGYSRQQGELSTTGQEHLSSVGASALLSEALSSQMTGRIQKLFGVSRIKIDPNVGGPENVAGARVTVEQQVTRDLMITYITDTGSSQRRVVQFEWQATRNMSLFGVRDRNGIFGVELRFRRRFK